MGYALDRQGFVVWVESGFVAPDAWLIHGVVEYRHARAAEARVDVVAEARLELMRTISVESRSARARGVRSVYVVVDGDDDVAGFFRLAEQGARAPGGLPPTRGAGAPSPRSRTHPPAARTSR